MHRLRPDIVIVIVASWVNLHLPLGINHTFTHYYDADTDADEDDDDADNYDTFTSWDQSHRLRRHLPLQEPELQPLRP